MSHICNAWKISGSNAARMEMKKCVFKRQPDVRQLGQTHWNTELIQLLCSGVCRPAVFIPPKEIDANIVCGLWLWSALAAPFSRQSTRPCAVSRHIQGFTTGACPHVTPSAEGYSSRFKVSSNISLSEMQLKKAQNTPIRARTNRFSMPSHVRPINWEHEHDWGSVSGRAGKGQSDDKRPLDRRKRTAGQRRGHEKETESLWDRQSSM